MLKNVLGVYLDGIKERQFDLPLVALLNAEGFTDIHFTHGNGEFGKDFIAKGYQNGELIQYSFQSKAGDISQNDWRTDIMGQMLESVISGLSHPHFDKNIPHQAILVTTGRLTGNAALGLQDLNTTIENTYHKKPIILWDRERLIPMLEVSGLGTVYEATASGYQKFGEFYQLYGKSVGSYISQRDFEQHSRQWLDQSIDRNKCLLCSAIESELFSKQCRDKGMLYEATISYLTIIRTIMSQIQIELDKEKIQELIVIYELVINNMKSNAHQFLQEFEEIWDKSDNNLSSIVPGPNNLMTYLIHCSRIMEMSGLLFFIENEQAKKDNVKTFLIDFINKEPGCARTPSDFYGISLVLPILVLNSTDNRDIALKLTRDATIWLCDRYQQGIGLADVSADPNEETEILCGYAFDFIKVHKRRGSFVATIISDLAAFLSDGVLYSNVINDFKASYIFPQYWQVPDNQSLFTQDSEDIIQYPNIEYSDTLLPFDGFSFAEHIQYEVRSFSITEKIGPLGLFMLMLLLRDRYFPTIWPSVTK